MSSLEDKDRRRLQFLHRCYELSDGNTLADINMWEVGDELGFSRDVTQNITEYLKSEGLIRFFGAGGAIVMTHDGNKEVEAAKRNPSKPTQHFSPGTINAIIVQNMTNSQIQQGSHGSTQSLHATREQSASLKEILPAIKEAMFAMSLSDSDRNEVGADLATLSLQAESPKPKAGIIKECGASLRKIAESAVGGVAARGIFENFDKLHF